MRSSASFIVPLTTTCAVGALLLGGGGCGSVSTPQEADPAEVPVEVAPETAAPPLEVAEPEIAPAQVDVPARGSVPDDVNGWIPEAIPPGMPERIAARHILVAWSGSEGADKRLRRSRAEAWRRVLEVRSQLADGADFAVLAQEYSDGPSGPRGGDLGPFPRGAMVPLFERAAFSTATGEITDVVETAFGFHVIQRVALEEVRIAHVLVQWAGGQRSKATRSRDEARERASQALGLLRAGSPVADVARDFSDGPTGTRGGDLGYFQRGQMMPTFENVAFALPPGGVSDVVETPLGFHVLVRLD